ncbi:MAG: TetR/AcrR family transcriptional regulator [Prolixibacteraceae bacterium]|jgi:AcrR family transcriptional regulator|nr:TetR/AcrR family transcriptional regulator [Prolixibacteraceae bacterium]MBT6006254.1 TetR/AcrR family transcriptional regulator [Prolixibacteraceae bacterium]MBT6764719.1 TetR/AcrR family transcriptional regulator [Prolixibacteraceae bacterium]MBT6997289.1 TetR/AcrR family transcriptional regulator [Prolixibacteraceae bacterium]MBT7394701.1 TetR/AcrR family transcriptional regulator [Prolixibacteraceae bacterium]
MQTERQIEIIEAALELITEKGIQGMTIKNLSKKIGITEPAIYRHFVSKTEILLSILNNFKEMAEILSGMMESYEAPASEKISFMFSKMLELFSEKPSMVSVIFSEEIFKNEEVLKVRIVEILNLHAQTVESIISKGQQEKNVREDIEIKSLALIAMGSFRLFVKRWDLNNHNFDLSTEGKKLITVTSKVLKK